MNDHHFIPEATALFERFAERHGLHYVIEPDPPIELLWTFPTQPGLKFPLTLGLQNCDELNFGVGDFWSYFFPYEKVEQRFETILDAWVDERARVAKSGWFGRVLQLRNAERWQTVYSDSTLPWLLKGRPHSFLMNDKEFHQPQAQF